MISLNLVNSGSILAPNAGDAVDRVGATSPARRFLPFLSPPQLRQQRYRSDFVIKVWESSESAILKGRSNDLSEYHQAKPNNQSSQLSKSSECLCLFTTILTSVVLAVEKLSGKYRDELMSFEATPDPQSILLTMYSLFLKDAGIEYRESRYPMNATWAENSAKLKQQGISRTGKVPVLEYKGVILSQVCLDYSLTLCGNNR